MSDVVEVGGPERPERPRRGWVVGAAAVVLLGAAAYGATRPDPGAGRRPAAAPSGSATEPGGDPGEVLQELPPEQARAGRWFDRPSGDPWPTALLLAGSGDRLRVMDLDSRRLTETPLPGRGPVDPVAPITGGWLAFRRGDCPDEPDGRCRKGPLYAVRGDRPQLVAQASTAVPDPDRVSVWLTVFTSLGPDRGENPRWLEHRTFDGTLLGPRTRLRAGEDLVAVAPQGPVVGSLRPGQLTRISGRGRKRLVLADGASVLGATGRYVAWGPRGCVGLGQPRCALNLTDTATGATTHVAEPRELRARVAVHPVGRFVAVAPFHQAPADDGVVVYETESGNAVTLGLRFPPQVETLTWSPDGWLVVTHTRYEHRLTDPASEVALWRPGLPVAVAGPDFPGWYHPVHAVGSKDVS